MDKMTVSDSRGVGDAKKTRSKLFYRIQEVAQITGIKPYVLRYWEREFSQLSPQKDTNDQRRYRQTDIDLIFDIKELLYNQKFTIAGARKRIRDLRSKNGNGAKAPAEGSSRQSALRGIRAELYDLMSLLRV
jgi:DNA-binding transcriptional MerR regulator